MTGPRDLDITLYGATGFVGRLVAEHLAQAAPQGVRIGLAGRSPDRLARVRDTLGARAAGWPLLEADATDAPSLRAMAARSSVVVSTVGPYQRHGIPLVVACAEEGTDYADLTGEVLFVREAIDRAHDLARGTGARIVVSCGFDSVPSDLGVHLLHRAARSDGAGGLTDTTLWVRRLRGGVSGGTIDSMRAQLARMRQDPSLRRVVLDPGSLGGGSTGAPGQRDHWRPFVEERSGRWAAPFFMGPYNTRVVRRSHALTEGGYGAAFRYRELVPTGRGARGALRATGMVAGLGAFLGALALPVVGPVVDRLLPAPGEGPDRATREAGSFRT
ncbi:MAG TPA: saccharopine dehydrogenase NADP-binding domain-containing protein, partial [Ornithinimicrobium sp.]|nr:saccharopine dehydrogenase NADP-binding domain-containing protein [Ornithinimicrobium sp.]